MCIRDSSGLGTTTYSMVYTLHAQNELPESLVGEGTSAIQFLQSMSGTIGLSIAGMVLNTSFARGLTGVVPEGLDAFLSAEELNGYMGTTLLTDPTAVEKAMAGLSEQGQTLFTQFVENLRSAYAGAIDVYKRQALEVRPKMIVAGASAYPRAIKFDVLADIAHEAGALLMVDMAHIAGLVAGGAQDVYKRQVRWT